MATHVDISGLHCFHSFVPHDFLTGSSCLLCINPQNIENLGRTRGGDRGDEGPLGHALWSSLGVTLCGGQGIRGRDEGADIVALLAGQTEVGEAYGGTETTRGHGDIMTGQPTPP